eukprot:TRINITY_DN15281_c0_g1_i1.p1 TRINITY_DN15281_c0_g1~~TRINITY_DN15281_c0_g1_i1.p1  ORF type:complete len:507 (-),score=95.12 TRINITY_DN15281_c0_g1_i1:181-1671(-)
MEEDARESDERAAQQKKKGTGLPELHSIHQGTVISLRPFGAFVQLGDGGTYKDGLLHISCISAERVEKVSDFLETGEAVWVKAINIKEDEGKYGLDMRYVNQKNGKDLDPKNEQGPVPKKGGKHRQKSTLEILNESKAVLEEINKLKDAARQKKKQKKEEKKKQKKIKKWIKKQKKPKEAKDDDDSSSSSSSSLSLSPATIARLRKEHGIPEPLQLTEGQNDHHSAKTQQHASNGWADSRSYRTRDFKDERSAVGRRENEGADERRDNRRPAEERHGGHGHGRLREEENNGRTGRGHRHRDDDYPNRDDGYLADERYHSGPNRSDAWRGDYDDRREDRRREDPRSHDDGYRHADATRSRRALAEQLEDSRPDRRHRDSRHREDDRYREVDGAWRGSREDQHRGQREERYRREDRFEDESLMSGRRPRAPEQLQASRTDYGRRERLREEDRYEYEYDNLRPADGAWNHRSRGAAETFEDSRLERRQRIERCRGEDRY